MIWVISVALAAFFNAVMDILENENFSSSVFRNRNPKWWYKRESWKWAKKVFGWKFDAWHVAKSTMVILMAVAIVSYKPIIGWWDIFIVGAVWNGVFNVSYKILKI